MKEAYIGIDAHKDHNVVALAFAGRGEPNKFRRPSERKAVAHDSGLFGGHSPAHRRG